MFIVLIFTSSQFFIIFFLLKKLNLVMVVLIGLFAPIFVVISYFNRIRRILFYVWPISAVFADLTTFILLPEWLLLRLQWEGGFQMIGLWEAAFLLFRYILIFIVLGYYSFFKRKKTIK